MVKKVGIIGRAGVNWHDFSIFASSVSPDTVSLLNVSTRFYLGVHAVRNIATTVYGSRRKHHLALP